MLVTTQPRNVRHTQTSATMRFKLREETYYPCTHYTDSVKVRWWRMKCWLVIIIIIIITTTIFIVLSSWLRSLPEFTWFIWWMYSSAKRPSNLRPSHLTWVVSPPVLGSYSLRPPSPFIIITQLESWYSFTVPRRVEGWSSRPRHWRKGAHSPCPRNHSGFLR